MSGGRFEYDQYKIGYIADSIQACIDNSGRPKTEEELREEHRNNITFGTRTVAYGIPTSYGETNHYAYPQEILEKFKEAVYVLRQAEVYAHRVDWFLSGEDSEENFLRRLNEDLNKIQKL